MISAMARHIRFLIYPGFVLLDLSGPLEVLSNASDMSGGSYRLSVASMIGGIVRSSSLVEVTTEPMTIETIDTLIVVGAPAPPEGSWVREIADAILQALADPDRMRQSFIRTLGHTPLELRRLSRQSAALSRSTELRDG